MEYANVKNAHIVPETYLTNWAAEGRIATWLLAEPRRPQDQGRRLDDQSTANVGTRRRFYRRERPRTGESIDDIEASLGEGEAKATPLLREFDARWPLETEDKIQLAELFGYQLLRGTRWKAEHEDRVRRLLAEYDQRPDVHLTEAERERQTALLASDNYRLLEMMRSALTIATVLGSMHWTLVEFATPLIATSDHPAVLWPGAASRAPQAVDITAAGLIECIEIRLPLSPRHAVLMSWSDRADEEDTRVRGSRAQAANFNAFTVATADRQWFHLPGSAPPRASGKLLPLSTQLVAGYTAVAAAESRRRQGAQEIANKKIGRDIHDREIEVVTVSRGRTA